MLTIHDIKAATREKQPFFFSDSTMRFFGQRLSGFKVKESKTGRVFIYAPARDRYGNITFYTFREFTGDDLVSVDQSFDTLDEIRKFIKNN